jgi:hypothetical protein
MNLAHLASGEEMSDRAINAFDVAPIASVGHADRKTVDETVAPHNEVGHISPRKPAPAASQVASLRPSACFVRDAWSLALMA